MDQSLDIIDLFQSPVHIETVAEWIHSEFWADQQVHSVESLAELLRLAKQPDQIPLSLLARVAGRPVGTINLIENDDEQRTHLRPWLAALVVQPDWRGQGIGSALVRTLQRRAKEMGIKRLYLGTDGPGFYQRLGARIHETVCEQFWVMQLDCDQIWAGGKEEKR